MRSAVFVGSAGAMVLILGVTTGVGVVWGAVILIAVMVLLGLLRIVASFLNRQILFTFHAVVRGVFIAVILTTTHIWILIWILVWVFGCCRLWVSGLSWSGLGVSGVSSPSTLQSLPLDEAKEKLIIFIYTYRLYGCSGSSQIRAIRLNIGTVCIDE